MRFSVLVCAIFTLFAASARAQWEADVRLTNDGANSNTSFPSQRCLAASGVTLHAVWYDYRDGNGDIYYKRSADNGSNWGADTRLTTVGDSAETPAVSSSGSDVHVVWMGNLDLQVHYRRSTDGGVTWLSPVVLTGSVYTLYPSVAADGQTVHLVWIDARPSTNYLPEVFYRRSTDGGATWQADVQLSNSAMGTRQPAVAFAGDVVHAVWDDTRHGLNAEIYYRRSTDRGQTWEAETRFTNADGFSFNGVVAAAGQYACVVWDDDRAGNTEIFYCRSTDGGATWEAEARLTNDEGDSYFPSITASGNCLHLTWMDNRLNDLEEWYNRSTDGGASWGPDTRLTESDGHSSYSTVVVSGTAVHVLWSDRRTSHPDNFEIYYKRNLTGNPGVEEIENGELRIEKGGPTVVRGVLHLPRDMGFGSRDTIRNVGRFGHVPSSDNPVMSRAMLLDASGRKVMALAPGPNDICHVAPGVYFVREERASAVRKVVVTR